MKHKFLVGIDPDVDKSGVAVQRGEEIELLNLTFFELFDLLESFTFYTEEPSIYIECGYLNKSNWHRNAAANSAFNAKIGEHTGANFAVAKKIVEMCEFLKLWHFEVKPTRTKLNADSFKQVTGITTRTNQENRDAYMLIFGR